MLRITLLLDIDAQDQLVLDIDAQDQQLLEIDVQDQLVLDIDAQDLLLLEINAQYRIQMPRFKSTRTILKNKIVGLIGNW